jgi:hypothetical protein
MYVLLLVLQNLGYFGIEVFTLCGQRSFFFDEGVIVSYYEYVGNVFCARGRLNFVFDKGLKSPFEKMKP